MFIAQLKCDFQGDGDGDNSTISSKASTIRGQHFKTGAHKITVKKGQGRATLKTKKITGSYLLSDFTIFVHSRQNIRNF